MKKHLILGMLIGTAMACTACGTKNVGQESKESVSESPASESPGSEGSASESTVPTEGTAEWSAEGNYINEEEDYLLIYYASVEDGYPDDGWTVTAIFGDQFYGGEMEEKDGILQGTIVNYDDNGEPAEEMEISLKEDGDNVVLVKEDGSESVFKVDETDYSDMAGDMLPMFSYNALYAYEKPDNLAAAAYDYLSFDYMHAEDVSNAMIPYVNIVGEDYADPKDVLVYGDYYLYEWKQDGDVLSVVSGGHYPGVIHMEMFGDHDNAAYTANSIDVAFTDADIKPLFGDYYDAYAKVSSDAEKIEAGTAQVLADYVHANGLSITKYQMSDGDVKELPASHAGDLPPSIDYGASEIYSIEEMDAAIALIEEEFYTWEGCEFHTIEYAGDECNSKENIEWMNTLEEGQDFTQCIEFLSSFHSPVEGGGAWEADREYEDWAWYLARSDGGDWHLLTWGY